MGDDTTAGEAAVVLAVIPSALRFGEDWMVDWEVWLRPDCEGGSAGLLEDPGKGVLVGVCIG